MKLDAMLQIYAQHLKSLAKAPKTVKQYIQWVQRFFDFVKPLGIVHPADVTTRHLRDYQRKLADKINAKGHISCVKVQNNHMLGVAMFLKFLNAEGIIAHNPARSIQYAKVPERLPRGILSVQEAKRLLQTPDTNTTLGYRDRTIMETLYATGMRRQELLNLTVNDIDLESGLVAVRHGKGGKDRVVPIGHIAAKYLETYINGIRPTLLKVSARNGKSETKRLFLSARGLPISRNALAERIAYYRGRSGIAQAVTPHTFRHSVATHMIRNQASIRHVQEMLGHVNLNTTEKYLHLTINDLKEAHHRFHPREKDT